MSEWEPKASGFQLERRGQGDRGRPQVELDMGRVEGVVSLGAAEEQPAGAAGVVGAEVEFVRLQSMAAMEAQHFLGAWIETSQAVVGAQPEPAGGIGMNTVDSVVGQSVAIIEVIEADGLGNQCAADDPIEAAASPDPNDFP